MRKKLIVIAVAIFLLIACPALAASGAPGSLDDPVVSKSYVDAATAFAPIELAAGKKLIGAEGAEVIVRSGEAFAIDNGANGVSDLTSGKDLMTGDSAELNHLLLIPRDDGRGITAATDIWVMVRGGYKIQ